MKRRSYLATVGAVAVAGCQSSDSKAAFQAPEAALVDSRLRIVLRDLRPDDTVKITARTDPTNYGSEWTASAQFVASVDGVVDLSTQAPLSGSYEDADPMGLFWSLSPDADPQDAFFAPEPHEVSLTATVGGNTVATTTIERRMTTAGVRAETLEDDLVGTLYTPPGDGSAPGVVILHGSSGVEQTATAKLLAAHGFVTLSLRYFGQEETLPDVLSEVPVEYAQRAVGRVLDHPRVGGQVGVWGVSKGAELALVLGAHDKRVNAVVALSPSSLVWEGFDSEGYPTGTSSWTVGGEPVPYLPYADYDTVPEQADPFERSRSFYEYSQLQANPERIAEATIPVEDIDGSVVMFSGTDDRIWHSTPMGNRIEDRLAEHDHPYQFAHHSYEGAGHVFQLPYLPTYGTSDSSSYTFGGAPAPNARASRDHWQVGIETLSNLEDDFSANPGPVTDSSPESNSRGEAGGLAAIVGGWVVANGAYARLTGEGSGGRWSSVAEFLRGTSGYVSIATLLLVVGGYFAVIGQNGIGVICVVLSFLVSMDMVSIHAWDWLHGYFEDTSGKSKKQRELTSHRISRTTKIVVVLGTALLTFYLLLAGVVALL